MMKIGRFFQIVALILIAGGAQPTIAAVWQWSVTASTNASVDPTINWAEGQSPSSINDSARAMMARLAEYRNDISGAILTGGTATAYTIITSQSNSGSGIPSIPDNGTMMAFVPHVTNGINPTLSVDTGTAHPLQSSAGVAIGAGTIVAGTPYRISYSAAAVAWVLEAGYGNPYAVPLGGLLAYTGTTAPNSNFVFPAGQCLSTTTYAAYWAFLGSPASGSCPGGQFAILDISGRVPAGLDTMPGFSAKNRLTSSGTGCGTAMTSIGASCVNGVEGSGISLAQLPTGITSGVTQTITVASNNLLIDATGVLLDFNPPSASGFRTPNNTASLRQQTSSGSNNINVTSNNTSGTSRPQVMPVVGVTYLLRVL